MKATALSVLALLLAAGPLRADPPGAVQRIETGGGLVLRVGGRVDGLALGEGATDADLAGLCEVRGLDMLYLLDTEVTDEGLRVVAGLPGVRSLVLRGRTFTDAGLRRLEAM